MKKILAVCGVIVGLFLVGMPFFLHNYKQAHYLASSEYLEHGNLSRGRFWSSFVLWGSYESSVMDSGSKWLDIWMFDFNQPNDSMIYLLNSVVEDGNPDHHNNQWENIYILALEAGYTEETPFTHSDIIEHADNVWEILNERGAFSFYLNPAVQDSPYYIWKREKYGSDYYLRDLTLYWREEESNENDD